MEHHKELRPLAEASPPYDSARPPQDAAHALLNTITLLQMTARLERRVQSLQFAVVAICLLMVAWFSWWVWRAG